MDSPCSFVRFGAFSPFVGRWRNTMLANHPAVEQKQPPYVAAEPRLARRSDLFHRRGYVVIRGVQCFQIYWQASIVWGVSGARFCWWEKGVGSVSGLQPSHRPASPRADPHAHFAQPNGRQTTLSEITTVAISEHFQSIFRAISESTEVRRICEKTQRKQFLSIFRAFSEQFQSSFRAVSEQFLRQ